MKNLKYVSLSSDLSSNKIQILYKKYHAKLIKAAAVFFLGAIKFLENKAFQTRTQSIHLKNLQ